MNQTTTIKEKAKRVQETCLLLTGIGYKIMKDGKVTEEKQKTISEMTDVVIDCGDQIMCEAKKLDTREAERSRKMESLKKDVAVSKRKLAEAVLEKEGLEEQCKRLREERDRWEEECASVKRELKDARKSLAAVSFSADDSFGEEDSAGASNQSAECDSVVAGSPLMTSTQTD